ncbi:hypothetical protein Q4Q49_10315 [Shewanella sp. SP1S1-7]|uniref:hypothetical protein n=1 Tax=Shewanella sp. SP1S1-7 TaxID=3063536 RepID=UPI002890F298|nr:hypothetical protein [Shewanella sp. SP1S1-7]MDT3335692.1 hypothetical protein [Shewanella sp. SP1S1-7]
MRVRLPIPANWQDFESLCHRLWKEVWCDSNAQRHGRSGQSQSGVDIYGRPVYGTSYAGVQCKDKDGRLGSTLTEKQLLKECADARAFTPQLQAFTLATTAPSDQAIQSVARDLNAKSTFPFDVHVWSWDEIEAEIACRPTLVNAFYPSAPVASDAPSVKISVSAPKDQFFAFFSRPQLVEQLGPSLKESLIQVSYELCDNAFVHGGARHIELSFDGTRLLIRDDGASFNPLAGLDSTKVSRYGNLGSYVLDAFRKKHGVDVAISHTRDSTNGRNDNVLQFEIQQRAKCVGVPAVLDIQVDLSTMFGRQGAKGLAEEIVVPIGTKEVVITVSDMFNVSGTIHFIHCLREKLPPSILLVISHPRTCLLGELSHLFDSSLVKFQPR